MWPAAVGPRAGATALADAGRKAGWNWTAVMATCTSVRKIANFVYPPSIFPWHGTRLREKGESVPLAAPERKSQSCEKNRCFLAARTRGSYADAELEVSQGSSQTTVPSWHTSTLSWIVDSAFPSLGNLLVVMVQPTQDRNRNHPGSFVLSGTR